MAAGSKAEAAARVALVIGNSDYRFAKPLPNPVNDANDIAVVFLAYAIAKRPDEASHAIEKESTAPP